MAQPSDDALGQLMSLVTPAALLISDVGRRVTSSRLVWLQGFIAEVSTASGDGKMWYVLDDGSATIPVAPVEVFCKDDICDVTEGLTVGAYCCVVGSVEDLPPPDRRKVISATQIRRLSPQSKNAEAMWLATVAAGSASRHTS
jgi:hypothetical protein